MMGARERAGWLWNKVMPRRAGEAPQHQRPWERPGVAVSAAVLLWAGLIVVAFLIPMPGGLSRVSTPAPGLHPAAATREAPARVTAVTSPSEASRLRRQARGRGDGSRVKRSALHLASQPEDERSGPPRFRVVSGTLARNVAELRARALAGQGADAFVRMMSGNIAQLQYGAYRLRRNAQAEAWRLRAQGYTAVIVPW